MKCNPGQWVSLNDQGKCVEVGRKSCVYRRQGNDKQLRLQQLTTVHSSYQWSRFISFIPPSPHFFFVSFVLEVPSFFAQELFALWVMWVGRYNMALRCQSKLLESKCVHKRISQLKRRRVNKFVGNAETYVANIMQLLMKVAILGYLLLWLKSCVLFFFESLWQMPENYTSDCTRRPRPLHTCQSTLFYRLSCLSY